MRVLAPLLALLCFTVARRHARAAQIHDVSVSATGVFSPQALNVSLGDTVRWTFADRMTASVIPVDSSASCTNYQPIGGDFDFTGPLGVNASGLFLRGPKDAWLNSSGLAKEDYAQEGVTGGFVRIFWNSVHLGPGQFDWTLLDQEAQKAVDAGKVFTVALEAGKSTPSWIFDPEIGGVEPLSFRDFSDVSASSQCFDFTLGSPADPKYVALFLNATAELISHLKTKNAWWRALAQLKLGGASKLTPEQKLPVHCNESSTRTHSCTTACNVQIWADAGYRPSKLYKFFQDQTNLIATLAPRKQFAYELLAHAFPDIAEDGTWTTKVTADSTQQILKQTAAAHPLAFTVQNNALTGQAQAAGFQLVKQAGERGLNSGFQTMNLKKVDSASSLQATLDNAFDNTDSRFVEFYVELLGQPGVPDVLQKSETRLHERAGFAMYPKTHSFTFNSAEGSKKTSSNGVVAELFYVHGAKCPTLPPAQAFGVIRVLN